MESLQTQAALFIQLCHGVEVRMRHVLLESELTAAEGRNIQKDRDSLVIIWVCAAAAAAMLSILLGSVTGGVSIFVFGLAAAFASIVALLILAFMKTKELINSSKMSRVIRDFILLLGPLQNSLERLKASCESLSSKSPEGEALKFTRLEVNILQILNLLEKLRNSSAGSEVTQQNQEVRKLVDEIMRMKTDLKTFY